MKLKGSQIIIECLIEQNVETIFGYPGGQVIDIFDALYEARGRISQILTSHEQGASHAADGYARASGKPGVVLATSGPGATNLVTGIATAYMDSIPLIAITGNVGVNNLGRDSFQEVDICGVTMPITKHNVIVKDVHELADTLRQAFRIAVSGRPGPVLVDIPKDVQQAICEYSPAEIVRDNKIFVRNKYFDEAVEIINSAKKPLILAGGGCIAANASDELVRLSELISAPVALTMMGLGAFPASHPNYLGLVGMHGKSSVANAMSECDVIVAVGTRFSDRVAGNRDKFCDNAKIVHIDVDAAEFNKNIRIDKYIKGDAKQALTELLTQIVKTRHGNWAADCAAACRKEVLDYSNGELSPYKIIAGVKAAYGNDIIIATDVGQHQMWVAQTYKFEAPRTLLTSGGLGTMGYGLGAAIGASIATDKKVVLFTGDGCFHMNFNEIVTAAKLGRDITVLVMNNHALGMVRQWQTLFYSGHYSSTDLHYPTDYAKLTEALGGTGFKITKNTEIACTLEAARNLGGIKVIDCLIDSDDMVLPIVPPGKAFDSIITALPKKKEG